MAQRDVVFGLDIGSGSVHAVAVEKKNDTALQVLAAAASPNFGMRKGAVHDAREVSRAISSVKQKLMKNFHLDMRRAFVGLSDPRLNSENASGSIAVSRADGSITEEDVLRVRKTAEETLPRLQNRYIVYQFPGKYSVDGDVPVDNPTGMNGLKLECTMHFLTAFYPNLKNVQEAVDLAGVGCEETVPVPLAESQLVLSSRQREIGVLLINLGAQTTEICVWEEGSMVSLEVLPFGSNHITHDIALGFRINIDDAEKLKRSYETIVEASKRDLQETSFADLALKNFTPRRLTDMIEARLSDIFELTEKHLKKIGRSRLLPAGAVLTGGGTKLAIILETARNELNLPVDYAEMKGIISHNEPIEGPEWSSAIAIAKWGTDHDVSPFELFFPTGIYHRLKKLLRNLVP